MASLTDIVESSGWKKFMAKLYGWGASVVIVGALFKIQHMKFAGLLLTVGLLTEATIFFFSAILGSTIAQFRLTRHPVISHRVRHRGALKTQQSVLWKFDRNATISATRFGEKGADDEILFGFRKN